MGCRRNDAYEQKFYSSAVGMKQLAIDLWERRKLN